MQNVLLVVIADLPAGLAHRRAYPPRASGRRPAGCRVLCRSRNPLRPATVRMNRSCRLIHPVGLPIEGKKQTRNSVHQNLTVEGCSRRKTIARRAHARRTRRVQEASRRSLVSTCVAQRLSATPVLPGESPGLSLDRQMPAACLDRSNQFQDGIHR